PFFRPLGFAKLAEKLKAETDKNIWCYTGYVFEELVKNQDAMKLLRNLDVLVDGPFKQELKDEDLLYRGSSNQRLVDVQKSLEAGRFVEFDYNPFKLQ
ncbi:MAG: radical SAM protein, partial [Paludibacteraceae bacterium]|nr:radical SAM protein [Paludibacteraceae bacterium]